MLSRFRCSPVAWFSWPTERIVADISITFCNLPIRWMMRRKETVFEVTFLESARRKLSQSICSVRWKLKRREEKKVTFTWNSSRLKTILKLVDICSIIRIHPKLLLMGPHRRLALVRKSNKQQQVFLISSQRFMSPKIHRLPTRLVDMLMMLKCARSLTLNNRK